MTDLIPRDAAISVMTDEADRCDDAVKWGGHRRYIQDCKAASFALRSRVSALRAIPTIDPAAIREAGLREAAAVIIDIRDRHEVMPSRYEIMPQRWREAILALIGEKK